jgi:hypothetical protein
MIAPESKNVVVDDHHGLKNPELIALTIDRGVST